MFGVSCSGEKIHPQSSCLGVFHGVKAMRKAKSNERGSAIYMDHAPERFVPT